MTPSLSRKAAAARGHTIETAARTEAVHLGEAQGLNTAKLQAKESPGPRRASPHTVRGGRRCLYMPARALAAL